MDSARRGSEDSNASEDDKYQLHCEKEPNMLGDDSDDEKAAHEDEDAKSSSSSTLPTIKSPPRSKMKNSATAPSNLDEMSPRMKQRYDAALARHVVRNQVRLL